MYSSRDQQQEETTKQSNHGSGQRQDNTKDAYYSTAPAYATNCQDYTTSYRTNNDSKEQDEKCQVYEKEHLEETDIEFKQETKVCDLEQSGNRQPANEQLPCSSKRKQQALDRPTSQQQKKQKDVDHQNFEHMRNRQLELDKMEKTDKNNTKDKKESPEQDTVNPDIEIFTIVDFLGVPIKDYIIRFNNVTQKTGLSWVDEYLASLDSLDQQRLCLNALTRMAIDAENEQLQALAHFPSQTLLLVNSMIDAAILVMFQFFVRFDHLHLPNCWVVVDLLPGVGKSFEIERTLSLFSKFYRHRFMDNYERVFVTTPTIKTKNSYSFARVLHSQMSLPIRPPGCDNRSWAAAVEAGLDKPCKILKFFVCFVCFVCAFFHFYKKTTLTRHNNTNTNWTGVYF